MRKVILSILLIIILLVVILIYVSFDLSQVDHRLKIQLDQCVDGDTAWFIIDGEKEKVRFLGIDTPESTNGFIEDFGVDGVIILVLC